MNRDDVIRMAREAGFHCYNGCADGIDADLERFAQAAYAAGAAAEREACHALRQTLPNPHKNCQVSAHAYDMAIVAYGAAIRARG